MVSRPDLGKAHLHPRGPRVKKRKRWEKGVHLNGDRISLGRAAQGCAGAGPGSAGRGSRWLTSGSSSGHGSPTDTGRVKSGIK